MASLNAMKLKNFYKDQEQKKNEQKLAQASNTCQYEYFYYYDYGYFGDWYYDASDPGLYAYEYYYVDPNGDEIGLSEYYYYWYYPTDVDNWKYDPDTDTWEYFPPNELDNWNDDYDWDQNYQNWKDEWYEYNEN